MKNLAQIIIIAIVSLSAFFTYELKDLKFDYDYEKFFPKDDEQMQAFEAFRSEYGGDSDFFLLGLENKEGKFEVDFLKDVKALGDSLKNHPNITSVFSPVNNAVYPKDAGFSGIVLKDYLDLNSGNISEKDSLFIYSNPNFIGSILPEKGESVAMIVFTDSKLSKKKAQSILKHLDFNLGKYNFDKVHKGGRLIAQTYYVQKMIWELVIFISTSVLVLIVFLYISFRSLWGVIIPLFVVIISNVWTLAIMLYTDKDFDLLLMMLPTIIFVVGMSDLVHLLTKYIEELRKGNSKQVALKVSFKEVRWATFLTSLTTSIGFFALLSSKIVPIREFGLYSGIGVFVAYFLAFTLLPSVLHLSKVPQKVLDSKQGLFWDELLAKLLLWVFKYRGKIVIGVLGLATLGVFSASQLEINNYLLEDLSDSDPVKQDVAFFEKNYTGIRPFELEVAAQGNHVISDFAVAQEIEKISAYLKSNYTKDGVGFLLSPNSLFKEVNFLKHRSEPTYRALPNSERKHKKLIKQIERLKANDDFQFNMLGASLVSTDQKRGRITGKIHDVGGKRIIHENESFLNFIKEEINPDIIQVTLTGTAMLIDKNNSTLASSMVNGLAFAFLVIGVIVGIMFKSIRLALLSLIPNILPLLVVTIVMLVGGIDLKISTSLIFTLSFGIAVDDTIHILAKYKLERKKGRSHLYALKRSYLSSGKAVIVTTLILVGGFLTLLFSTFASTFYMGLLVGITLLFAVALDLLILPIIMLYGVKD